MLISKGSKNLFQIKKAGIVVRFSLDFSSFALLSNKISNRGKNFDVCLITTT